MRSRLLTAVTALAVTLAGLTTLTLVGAAPASADATVFPVPTSAAGLSRIVTAPNGNMWFVERDANKLGRVTPSGAITELPLYTSGDYTTAKDVDVAPNGTIWVLYNSGRYVAGVNDAGVAVRGPYNIGDFGQELRVAPDGTVWITVSFDQQYVVRIAPDGTITDLPNSPECEDALGRAADGSMWCRTSSGLTHLGASGGGTTYPANNFAAHPYAIAAGPVGSIWFGRYFSGTYVSSPDDGEVGYLDAATSAVKAFDTGSRTAPRDLVQGPDGAMWFASVGAAKGIGHVTTAGTGALTQIGGYAPTSLTFGIDGAVWATDSTNNSIIRVATSELQTTNVDPGTGSVFTLGKTAASGGVNAGLTKVKVSKKPLAVKKNKVALKLTCLATAAGGCSGSIGLETAKKVSAPGKAKKGKKPKKARAVVTKPSSFTMPAGGKTTVKLTLSGTGKKLVRPGRVTSLKVVLGGVAAKKIKVRR